MPRGGQHAEETHIREFAWVVLIGALREMISSLLVFQAGAGARCGCDGARWPLSQNFWARASALSDTDFSTWMAGFRGGVFQRACSTSGLSPIFPTLARCSRFVWSQGVCSSFDIGSRTGPCFPGPWRTAGAHHHDIHVSSADGGPADHELDSILVWMILGLVLYYFYGRKHSTLRRESHVEGS